jgi:hypothetical protein
MPAKTRTWTQYRIESRGPGERRFRFVPFSGAGPFGDPDALAKLQTRITGAREESPGWSFRISVRTVITTVETTKWSPR